MATTIFRGGRFFTPSAETTDNFIDECVVVENDTIVHVGRLDDPKVHRAKRQHNVKVVDLGNKIVVPGFIDGHMHLLLTGLAMKRLNLEHCKNLDDIRSAIKKYAAKVPSAPRILCRGWMVPMTNGVALASQLNDLDSRPIFIDSKDLHSTWCNSAALRELNITPTSPSADSIGGAPGSIARDPDTSEPTGLLSEDATFGLVWPHITNSASTEQKLAAMSLAFQAYTASGFTGVCEMGMDENSWQALCLLREKEGGKLSIRVAAHWLIIPHAEEKDNLRQVDRAIELHRAGYNTKQSPDFLIAGIKFICDGVIDACTAGLLEPYTCKINGGKEATTGSLLWTPEMLRPVVARAVEADLQVALHAIGDLAVRNAIDVIESHGGKPIGQKSNGSKKNTDVALRRHRIEHLELTTARDAARLGPLGITASVQPMHSDPTLLTEWPSLIGPHRCKRTFAFADFLAHGANMAFGSDAPVAPFEPLPALYTASTRRSARDLSFATVSNPQFAITLAQAVSSATYGAARACFADHFTGRLEVGMKADFAILSEVVKKWEGSEMIKVGARVVQTWFEGKCVFDEEIAGIAGGIGGL